MRSKLLPGIPHINMSADRYFALWRNGFRMRSALALRIRHVAPKTRAASQKSAKQKCKKNKDAERESTRKPKRERTVCKRYGKSSKQQQRRQLKPGKAWRSRWLNKKKTTITTTKIKAAAEKAETCQPKHLGAYRATPWEGGVRVCRGQAVASALAESTAQRRLSRFCDGFRCGSRRNSPLCRRILRSLLSVSTDDLLRATQ